MRKSNVFSGLAVGVIAALLGGCVSNTPAPLVDYQPESFDASNVFAHHYAVSPARTCEAARRVLLGQGYVLDAAKPNQVTGRKSFQPDVDHHVQLEFRVVCTAKGQDTGGSAMVFANGLLDQYSLRKTKESASLGVGAFGSVSLPLGGGTDAMVKVASQTMTDARLYQRFFDLIGNLLESGEVPENLPSPPAESAAASAPVATAVQTTPIVMFTVPALPAAPASDATPALTPAQAVQVTPAVSAAASAPVAPASAP